MSEDIKEGINEILGDVDQLLTEEYIEGVTLWDLVLGAFYEVVEERAMYGNDWAQVPNDNSIGDHEPCLREDNNDTPGEYVMCSRGIGKQSRINELLHDSDRVLTEGYIEEGTLWDSDLESFSEAFARIESGKRYVAEDMSTLASLMEHFSKSGHSVADWAEATYSVSPITLESLTDTTEERARPKKRGERCDTCSNMKKKELKKYDSCPTCGRSLFALKSRGW